MAFIFIVSVLLFLIFMIATSSNRKYLFKLVMVNIAILISYNFLANLFPLEGLEDLWPVFLLIGINIVHIIILVVFVIGRYKR